MGCSYLLLEVYNLRKRMESRLVCRTMTVSKSLTIFSRENCFAISRLNTPLYRGKTPASGPFSLKCICEIPIVYFRNTIYIFSKYTFGIWQLQFSYLRDAGGLASLNHFWPPTFARALVRVTNVRDLRHGFSTDFGRPLFWKHHDWSWSIKKI